MQAQDSSCDWIQLALAITAIGAGFLYIVFQRWAERRARRAAAARLAKHSVDFVTDRLEALVEPGKPTKFALRGARATEMIEVMRAVDVSMLPPEAIEPVALIRSAIYAINVRVDEVLKDDADRRGERRRRLYSAGRNLTMARTELQKLQPDLRLGTLSQKMIDFLAEAEAEMTKERAR